MRIKKLINNLNKFSIIGSGPELLPPDPVDKLLLSYENFSVADLLCEGPVAGIVDKFGRYTKGIDSLAGLYFENVPVKESSESQANYYEYPIKISDTNNRILTAQELADYLRNNTLVGLQAIVNNTSGNSNQLGESKETIEFAKTLALEIENLILVLEGFYSKDKNYNSNLSKKISPSTFYSNEIKFLIIDKLDLDNLLPEETETNINSFPNLKVIWKNNGNYGELAQRFKKSQSDDSYFNVNEMAVQIPEAINSLLFRKDSSYTGRWYFSRREQNWLNTEQKNDYYTRAGIFIIPLAEGDELNLGATVSFSQVDSSCIDPLSSNLSGAQLFLAIEKYDFENPVFNYNKVFFDFREGYEDQSPSYLVNKSTRSVNASFDLKGPIDNTSFIDRIDPKRLSLALDPSDLEYSYKVENNLFLDGPNIYSVLSNPELDNTVTAEQASSTDLTVAVDLEKVRTAQVQYDYAAWMRTSISPTTKEKREIYKHTIENSSVDEISIIFNIQQLFDTNIREAEQAGNPLPAFLEMAIIIGIEGDENEKDVLYQQIFEERQIIPFAIEGLVQQGYRFKVGAGSSFSHIKDTISNIENLKRLILPESIDGRNRYVKVLRITPETFSSKRTISVSISSIEEHQNSFFSYPLTAYSRITLDSRAFSSLPARTFDLKLKKVLIPSNYWPEENDGKDKRFIKNKSSYSNDTRIYYGDWDGTFRYGWTDNPAWILYDLLTNSVYGLGSSIDALEDINIWRLYEIGKYSDAVDDDGYFIGVDDGKGGLEPRFSCNLMINDETEGFDIINSIATIFRGNVFYAGSEIDFYFDRPQEPIAQFSNHNVKDGLFSYSDTLKSSRYTVVEVPYIDKDDDYIQKVEYYEDEENIDRYGYIKKSFQGIGITSRSQALRFAKYSLLSNKYETEKVNFVCSDEALFVEPGDVVRIQDELKNIDSSSNYILDIDYDAKTIVCPPIETGGFGDKIFLHKKTASKTIEQLFEEVYEDAESFDITKQNSYQPNYLLNLSVSSYEAVSAGDGGSGIKINLDQTDDRINELPNVEIGSTFSIQLTGRNDNLYKIISKIEIDNGNFEILAIKSEQKKYAEIESGIKFDKNEEYFANLSFDYNDNDPNPPSTVSLTSDSDLNLGPYIEFTITENSSGPVAEKYECILISPQGNVSNKIIDKTSTTTTVRFYNLKEFNGEYTAKVYSIGAKPLKLKSETFTSASINVDLADFVVYNKFHFRDVFIDSYRGDFDYNTNGEGSGSFYLYIDKTIRINWSIKDRLGFSLNSKTQYLNHYDEPKISIDLLDTDNTFLAALKTEIQDTYAIINRTEIENKFSDEYPREFKLKLKISATSQSADHESILNISTPNPEFRFAGVSSCYDGIANRFILYGETPNFFKDKIEKIEIYTGESATIAENENNLLKTIENARGFDEFKTARVAGFSIYPRLLSYAFFSPESPNDKLFFHGEKIIFQSDSNFESYDNGLEMYKEYEIVMGRTMDSLILLNSDYSYERYYSENSIDNMSYYYTGEPRGYWDEFTQLSQADSNNHSNGGLGLLYGFQADYVINDDTKTLSLPNAISKKGYRKDVDSLFVFNNNGIRVAESGSSNAIQAKRQLATYTSAFKTIIDGGEQVIFDFSSPTGGILYYLEEFGGNIKYNVRAVTYDKNLNQTGEKINLTGILPGISPGSNETIFTAITIGTYPKEEEGGGETSLTEARFYFKGDLIKSTIVSGWGLNDHDHACGIGIMIGDSIDVSANSQPNSMGFGFMGDLLEFGVYEKLFSPQEVFKDYIGTRNEYFFQISTGNKEVFELETNVEDSLTIRSVNSSAYEFIIGQDGQRVKNGNTTLYEELYQNNLLNGVPKQISFEKTSDSSYDIIEEINESSFYLSEKDYLSEDYVWLNFKNPIYKLRYLENVADFDDPSALFLYSGTQYNQIKVTGAATAYVNSSNYDEGTYLFLAIDENETTETYVDGDRIYLRNLDGIDNIPKNSVWAFSSYQGGSDETKPILFIPNNYQPEIKPDFQIQNSGSIRKMETIGIHNGEWEGFIGGINGDDVNGNGNFKRYDAAFNDFISVTGYFPYGRWIVYSGISPSGNVGDLSWGGYDIIAHYTGEGVPERPEGQIRIGADVEKYPPIPSRFKVFKTDYSLLGRNAKTIDETFSLNSQIKPSTYVEYADFYVKYKYYDFIGGITSNNTYLVNYAYTEAQDQESNLIAISESLLGLSQALQDAQEKIDERSYSVPSEEEYADFFQGGEFFDDIDSPTSVAEETKLKKPSFLFRNSIIIPQQSIEKPFQFEHSENNVTIYYKYIITNDGQTTENIENFQEAIDESGTSGGTQAKTINITIESGDSIKFTIYAFKNGYKQSEEVEINVLINYSPTTVGSGEPEKVITGPSTGGGEYPDNDPDNPFKLTG